MHSRLKSKKVQFRAQFNPQARGSQTLLSYSVGKFFKKMLILPFDVFMHLQPLVHIHYLLHNFSIFSPLYYVYTFLNKYSPRGLTEFQMPQLSDSDRPELNPFFKIQNILFFILIDSRPSKFVHIIYNGIIS